MFEPEPIVNPVMHPKNKNKEALAKQQKWVNTLLATDKNKTWEALGIKGTETAEVKAKAIERCLDTLERLHSSVDGLDEAKKRKNTNLPF